MPATIDTRGSSDCARVYGQLSSGFSRFRNHSDSPRPNQPWHL